MQEVLDTDTTVVLPAAPVTEVAQHGTLEFRDVGFHYPGAEHSVLRDLSFTTAAGQTTAIIGSTGAGKTTLVSLIPRLFDATSGSVLVDGVDVRELEPEILWRSIGLVPQRPYLFSGTVASNLRYGKPDATEAEMWESLEVAQAADFVRAMGGLEATIEQGGTNVSGGQRQRLSIARALICRPEIYVFDDSFSALDLSTDARLRAALAPYTRNAAVVIVAQRVSTISTADNILVLEDGQVVGSGTHEELIESNPTYAEIVQSQIGEEKTACRPSTSISRSATKSPPTRTSRTWPPETRGLPAVGCPPVCQQRSRRTSAPQWSGSAASSGRSGSSSASSSSPRSSAPSSMSSGHASSAMAPTSSSKV